MYKMTFVTAFNYKTPYYIL